MSAFMTASAATSPLLAIDTAGPRLQLALAVDGRVDVLVEDLARGHAEIIFERIDALLTRNGLAYDALHRIAVTSGPGSFTGLRIGLSAARGLGLALGIPVIGVPTLLAMSLSGEEGAPFAVIVDARRHEAYVQAFAAPGDPSGDPAILPVAAARDYCAGVGRSLELQFCDVAQVALFAATADADKFPPRPLYIRAADAKPQTKGRIARVSETAR